MDLSTWMNELDEKNKSKPIIYLAIPGSHDSLSYSIKNSAPISPDSEPAVKELEHVFGCITRRVMHRWCVTQKCSVTEQLNMGIRFFDLRISLKPGDPSFYFVHGLYGEQINTAFGQIVDFLQSHDQEIVILDFQHFYELKPEDHERLISELKNIFGSMLCPLPYEITTVTLSWMKQEGYRVIVIYRDENCPGDGSFWPSNCWPTPWPETMNPTQLVEYLTNCLKRRPTNCGFVSQCLLTPTSTTVALHLFSNVKNKCALPAAKVAIPWLNHATLGSINVAIADFVDDNDAIFPQTVISLNKSLI